MNKTLQVMLQRENLINSFVIIKIYRIEGNSFK